MPDRGPSIPHRSRLTSDRSPFPAFALDGAHRKPYGHSQRRDQTEDEVLGEARLKSENPEKRRTDDQRRAAIGQFLANHGLLLARQGFVAKSWRCGERRSGPYYRLAYRDETGRQRSIYLGVDGELAAQVRQRLAELQTVKERRLLAKARRAARRALREAMKALECELAQLGLYLWGNEIRGWHSWTAKSIGK